MHRSNLKQAWLDEQSRIISFHQIEDSFCYQAEEPLFWEYIMSLARSGYRVQ